MNLILKTVLIGATALALFLSGVFYANVKTERRKPKLQPYHMKKKPKGKFLIINNKKFSHPEETERHGTNKDAGDLEKLFKDIGFDVIRKNDLQASGIRDTFEQMADTMDDDCCCFGAAILSHGGNGGVFGTDWQFVRTEDIMNKFSETSCPALKQKPKLFFIQACQKSGESSSDVHQGCFIDATPYTSDLQNVNIALKPDFFLAVATPLGYPAYRCEHNGSFFIRAIVKIFREHAGEEHLLHLMTMVTGEVQSQKIQVPVTKSSLSKLLYFNPAEDLLSARR